MTKTLASSNSKLPHSKQCDFPDIDRISRCNWPNSIRIKRWNLEFKLPQQRENTLVRCHIFSIRERVQRQQNIWMLQIHCEGNFRKTNVTIQPNKRQVLAQLRKSRTIGAIDIPTLHKSEIGMVTGIVEGKSMILPALYGKPERIVSRAWLDVLWCQR